MNRDSNAYTFIFSTLMVVIVAVALSFTATSLKERQRVNIDNEKMQNILSTIGIEVDREQAKESFGKYITEQLSLREDASVDKNVLAFDIDLAKEIKEDYDLQRYPVYIADLKGVNYYIIPLRGAGLWDAIWGYVALNEDANTVKGVVFDHKGETSGLGGEIVQKWFQERFVGETIFEDGKFVGITVQKGNGDPAGKRKDDHKVDAISGATITGDGVTHMIKERLKHYIPYFERVKKN